MEIIQPSKDFKGGRLIFGRRTDFFGKPLPEDLDDFFYTGVLFDINVRTDDPITGRKFEKNLKELTDEHWNSLVEIDTTYDESLRRELINLLRSFFEKENIGLLREKPRYLPTNAGYNSVLHTPSLLNIFGNVVQDQQKMLERTQKAIEGQDLGGGIEYRVAKLESPVAIVCHQSQLRPSSKESEIFKYGTYRLFAVNGVIRPDDTQKIDEASVITRIVTNVLMPYEFVYYGKRKEGLVDVFGHLVHKVDNPYKKP